MIAVAQEHQRMQTEMELRFMAAIRFAVPACLDEKSGRPFEAREERLRRQINGDAE